MTCDKCERHDVETQRHTVRYDGDDPARKADLCPPCVRTLRQDDPEVASIT